MITISFEINGKRVRPDELGDALNAAILSGIHDSIVKAVGDIRCINHNECPCILIKGHNLDELTFDISGCCEDVIRQVEQAL